MPAAAVARVRCACRLIPKVAAVENAAHLLARSMGLHANAVLALRREEFVQRRATA